MKTRKTTAMAIATTTEPGSATSSHLRRNPFHSLRSNEQDTPRARRMKSALLPISALLLTACVSSGPESQLGKEDKAKQRIEMTRTSDCVYQSTIDGFDALDETHVVLYSMGQRKAYLTELEGACFDVKGQSTLAAIDGDQNGQICGYGRDSIAYRRMGMAENCRILAMQQLSDERRIELGVGAPPPKPKKAEKPKPEEKPAETK